MDDLYFNFDNYILYIDTEVTICNDGQHEENNFEKSKGYEYMRSTIEGNVIQVNQVSNH